MTSTYGVLSVN